MESKSVVVTGCSRGLGYALSCELARLGHRVFGASRSEDLLSALRLRCPTGVFRALDVTSEDEVEAWAVEVQSLTSGVDFVLNNAALMNEPAPLWKIRPSEFRTVLETNVVGPSNVIRAFMPSMIERGRGVIVNFISGSGRNARATSGAYNASKWALEGLTLTLSAELPQGLAAVAFAPGRIDTGMLRKILGGEAASYHSPETWARDAAPFLLQLGAESNGRTVLFDRELHSNA